MWPVATMTLRIEETQDSRMLSNGYEPNQKAIEVELACWDDTYADLDPVNVNNAVLAVLNAAPFGDPLYGLRLQTIQLRPITKSIFMAVGHYGVFEAPQKTDPTSTPAYRVRVGFSTSGGTEHITHSLETLNRYPATGFSAPDQHLAMNIVKGVPQGTSKNVGQLSFRVTGYFDPSVWTPTEWLNLNELTNTWNLSAWKGWPEETLLFQHAECADYEQGKGDLVPVTYHFLVRRDESVDKGNGIGPFTKHPWSYLWDLVVEQKDASTPPQLVKRIAGTYEEQIYSGSDFSLLGLGT